MRESRRIVQQAVPLDYHRVPRQQMNRYAVIDQSAPPPRRVERADGSVFGDTYFADTSRIIKRGLNGRPLKNPRFEITPGAEPGVVAFADTHPWGEGGVYIDYMKTRSDQTKLGHATALVSHIAQQHPGVINFGTVLHPSIWKMMGELEAQGRRVMGKKDF